MIVPKIRKPSAADERDAYELVTLRDSDTCQRCRHAQGVNRDHRKNRSQGGLSVVSNLQLLCGSGTTGCHGWVTTNPADALAEGWSVPGWATPSEWPARRWLRTRYGTVRLSWVLYGDAGEVTEISEIEASKRRGTHHVFTERRT